ncbi:MAG: GNAT family N-acetyltransferase [Propionibacterium sp.]|nr:GNAT family N-acetyltransferase [Propionibacterium sp.]
MGYEYRTERFESGNVDDHPWFPGWLEVVQQGFHDGRPTERVVRRALAVEAGRGSVARGAYPSEVREFSLPLDHPVATFTEWTGSLNVGGALLEVLQITDVTVRASHRRRGLLRRLMTDSLVEAKARGLAIATLTATEATIYGRFGFGPAVFREDVELRTGPDFRLTTHLRGTVDFLDPASLDDVAARVFAAFHRAQTGSIARFDAERPLHTGALRRDTYEPDTRLRAAAHWDEGGVVDGYVTWTAEEGGKLTVRDLIAADEHARLCLWNFLGSLDLIHTIHARGMRPSDPLPWSLADRRWYRTSALSDFLWLRVLDAPAVFAARDYVHDGSVALRVTDPMGLADGAWLLDVRDGAARVEAVEGADVEVDVAALSSAILDGVRISTLEAAGLIRGERRAIDTFESLLSRRRAPWCATAF